MESMWLWQVARLAAVSVARRVLDEAAGRLRMHRLVCDTCNAARSGWAATELGAFQLAEQEGWFVGREARSIQCPACGPYVHAEVRPLRRVPRAKGAA
jgi:hypothetical protein